MTDEFTEFLLSSVVAESSAIKAVMGYFPDQSVCIAYSGEHFGENGCEWAVAVDLTEENDWPTLVTLHYFSENRPDLHAIARYLAANLQSDIAYYEMLDPDDHPMTVRVVYQDGRERWGISEGVEGEPTIVFPTNNQR